MSKRDQGASLSSYLEEGYAPEAVVNYLSLLGWSPKGNREKISRSEVVEIFDLPQILRHNARFDLTKLRWLNAEYIREMHLGTQIVAVDAVGSAIFHCEIHNRLIPGHGASIRPPLLDGVCIDRVVHVRDIDCVVGCRRLVQFEGILAGGSSGAVPLIDGDSVIA